MPIYEYQCQACGKEMEVSQRITEPALTECPECHEPKLQRLISATSFHLKGGGWYKDGYGTGSDSGKKRTENDRIDRVSKAIADDKAQAQTKTASSSESGASTPSSSGGGGSGGGDSKAA